MKVTSPTNATVVTQGKNDIWLWNFQGLPTFNAFKIIDSFKFMFFCKQKFSKFLQIHNFQPVFVQNTLIWLLSYFRFKNRTKHHWIKMLAFSMVSDLGSFFEHTLFCQYFSLFLYPHMFAPIFWPENLFPQFWNN